jgi:hypothetical protein
LASPVRFDDDLSTWRQEQPLSSLADISSGVREIDDVDIDQWLRTGNTPTPGPAENHVRGINEAQTTSEFPVFHDLEAGDCTGPYLFEVPHDYITSPDHLQDAGMLPGMSTSDHIDEHTVLPFLDSTPVSAATCPQAKDGTGNATASQLQKVKRKKGAEGGFSCEFFGCSRIYNRQADLNKHLK